MAIQASFPGFPPQGLRFLRQLKRHNERAWFLEHKRIYEVKLKLPMVGLVQALGSEMRGFAGDVVSDPSKCIYRIYRDVRFSRDKSPYKTHVAALFPPRGMAKHAGAGYYVQISPEEVLVAGGVYMPGSKELLAIRKHIARNHPTLVAILAARSFKRHFGSLEGEQLTRPPKGFVATHPAIEWLRYKQFLVSAVRPASLAQSSRLLPEVLRLFRAMAPLIRFLNAPLI